MRLRNNPKAYEIMEENADLVILKPEEHKGHYHDIFEINQPLYKLEWGKAILFIKML